MTDVLYKKTLAKGLNIKDVKSLSIIMGPEELKSYLNGLTLDDFDDGKQLISLHTHSNVSDGKLNPKDYLNNALSFKQKYGYRNLVLALTDHDMIDGLPVVLKQAQKNPQKYAGIRLVLGCELSLSYFDDKLLKPVDFELLHYGINPFDKEYAKWLEAGRKQKINYLPKIFDFFKQKYPTADLSLEEFLTLYPRDARGFGCYIAYDTPRYIISKVGDSERAVVLDYFRSLDAFWHSLDDVMTMFKKHGFGFLSVAHPYRIQLEGKINENGPDFLNRFFNILKEKGVEGLEIFYMNLHQPLARSFDTMYSGAQPVTDTDRWVKTILDFATNNQMIRTGGTDSHTDFIAGRKRLLVAKLTEKLQSYVPLIRRGYKVLGKEVTLGLPSPCMPAKSAYENTGIGSVFGDGAERIKNVFGGLFDKIQLGPTGKTNAQAKHSPYVSGSMPSPFLIPLEKLASKGWISTKTLTSIYDISKSNDRIDFELVERMYDKALKEAHRTSKTNLSYDEFILSQIALYGLKNDISCIADLQVHIPLDTQGLSEDMFLPGFSLGSPADKFSDKPRNWHFKVFNPEKLFNDDGSLGPAGKVWYDLIDKVMKTAKGGLRVDHYIGFVNPFVISDDDPSVCGRLYSSPNIPQLAPFAKKDFSDITKKILLAAAKKNGLKASNIYVEDLGARPEQLDDVMNKCGLGRLLIAEFWDTNDENHLYHLAKANKTDVACLDTHDLPSVQMFFESMPEDKRRAFAAGLAKDLRFDYNDILCDVKQLVRMQWAALMASPARRVQAFFTSWTGQRGQYNQPGNPDKWTLRSDVNFDRIYFENLAKGMAYNPFDAICLAIYAQSDEFYRKNERLVHQLKMAEDDILSLAKEL